MTRKEILAEAEKCVCGDRNLQYGEPDNREEVKNERINSVRMQSDGL